MPEIEFAETVEDIDGLNLRVWVDGKSYSFLVDEVFKKMTSAANATICQCVREEYFELTESDGSKTCSGCGERR